RRSPGVPATPRTGCRPLAGPGELCPAARPIDIYTGQTSLYDKENRASNGTTRTKAMAPILPQIHSPQDLQGLGDAELEQLTQEMRDELVRVLSIRPAHFASNLGVIELCVALHLTFDFRQDRLIWDTGHQIYPHKLITGRYPQFESIRTRGGLMGYPNPQESPYDLFMTGHAGCSLSCSLGLKVGDELLGHGERHS